MKKLGYIGIFCLLAFTGALHAVETRITGGKMELLGKGDQVVFTGGVKLARGADTLLAKEMVTNKNRDRVRAQEDVQLFRKISSTENWKAFGDEGYYETQQGSGYIIGSRKKAHLIRTEIFSSTMTRVTHLYADRFDFTQGAEHAVGKGRVQGETFDPASQTTYEFFAEQADYDGKKKVLVLSGLPQPTLIQTGNKERKTMNGDVIIYYIDSRRLVSEGKARAVFVDLKNSGKDSGNNSR